MLRFPVLLAGLAGRRSCRSQVLPVAQCLVAVAQPRRGSFLAPLHLASLDPSLPSSPMSGQEVVRCAAGPRPRPSRRPVLHATPLRAFWAPSWLVLDRPPPLDADALAADASMPSVPQHSPRLLRTSPTPPHHAHCHPAYLWRFDSLPWQFCAVLCGCRRSASRCGRRRGAHRHGSGLSGTAQAQATAERMPAVR